MMRILLAIAACCWAIDVAGQEAALLERGWTVDGVARQALVYAPESAKSDATPVVFAFHGHGGTMRQASLSFHDHTVWPEALVIYPQGLNTPGQLTDPAGKRSGWQKQAGDQDDRDLKFFDAMLASIEQDYKVDARRIYATGHSNGGGFTYVLWSARGDVFAAVAPSSAALKRGMSITPKPALHLAGETDPLVKYEWQQLTMQLVRKVNGCDEDGTAWGESGPLVGTIYASKRGTPFVSLLYSGGHKFPPEAPALIVKFFKEHAKGE